MSMITLRPREIRVTLTQYVNYDPFHCIACWTCISTCPGQVIVKAETNFRKYACVMHPENCTGCRLCVDACPTYAITPVFVPPKQRTTLHAPILKETAP